MSYQERTGDWIWHITAAQQVGIDLDTSNSSILDSIFVSLYAHWINFLSANCLFVPIFHFFHWVPMSYIRWLLHSPHSYLRLIFRLWKHLFSSVDSSLFVQDVSHDHAIFKVSPLRLNHIKYWKQSILLLFNPHPLPFPRTGKMLLWHSSVQHTPYRPPSNDLPRTKKTRKEKKTIHSSFPTPPFYPLPLSLRGKGRLCSLH